MHGILNRGMRTPRHLMWAVIPLLLLLPVLGMTVSDAVRWTASDFIIATLLLVTGAGAAELVLRLSRGSRTRLVGLTGVALALALIWGELAVGLFGSPWAGS
ncbi:hypothetical protein EYB45_06180 [Erythrobacteraceae bacterium CFH 75059]|nr:hypothetical protein EYB45_06180 [Erythrobacteraceae bacterium CFH 75059]